MEYLIGSMMDTLPAVLAPSAAGVNSEHLEILFVTARYLPHIGGTELHTYEVARRLSALGHRVTVLTTDPSNRLKGEDEMEGVCIKRVRAWPAGGDYYFAPDIYRIVRQSKGHLIHLQGYHTLVAPLTMLAAQRSRTPYVVTFHSGGHSSRVRNALRPLQRQALRPLLAHAERLIGVSNFEVNLFRRSLQLPASRFVMIPNGAYVGQSNGKKATTEQKTIVSIGRLEKYKGHHRVISALPEIAIQYPNIRLYILGEGPYDDALRTLATKLGVANRVHIGAIPPTERDTMASTLMKADLVILLSDYESQAIAVLEALSLGRPVLVADTSALKELAALGLVRATPLGGSTREVADAVLAQLREPLVPASSISLPRWDACTAQLLDLYQSIVRPFAAAEPNNHPPGVTVPVVET